MKLSNVKPIYSSGRKAALAATVILCATLAVHAFSGRQHEAQASPLPTAQEERGNTLAANCRYGTMPLDPSQVPLMSTLGAGWYVNFNPGGWPTAPGNDAEFVRVIRTTQDKNGANYQNSYAIAPPLDQGFANLINNNPGEIWIIGNEVDRGPDPGQLLSKQGDMFPDVYAQAYHDAHHFIKNHDPTATVALSALVEFTPGRRQYLDSVWQAYKARYGSDMPVDVFAMHAYVLPEAVQKAGVKQPNSIANVAVGTDIALAKLSSGGDFKGDPAVCNHDDIYCIAEHDDIGAFAEQLLMMRQWMKDHGQRDKPLIITEYSILYHYVQDPGGCFLKDEFDNCFTPQRVSNFMTATFNYMNGAADPALGYPQDNNRLVQQWLWYAVHGQAEGASSNLVEADLVTLTQPGQTFQSHLAAEPAARNLHVIEVPDAAGNIGAGATANIPISVIFRNNGNGSVEIPFSVTFYADAARSQEIGAAVVQPLVRGCATHGYVATVTWQDLLPGEYPFWAVVDSTGVVNEGGQEGDNSGRGTVRVFAHGILLPIAMKK